MAQSRVLTPVFMFWLLICPAAVQGMGPSVQGIGPRCAAVDVEDKCVMYGVSVIDLIAHRELLNGKKVRVIGYLHLEFEGNGLYLSREDFQHAIFKNGIWVHLDREFMANKRDDYNDRYVLLEGIFNPTNFGHLGGWSGGIEEITRLEVWGPFIPEGNEK